MSAHRVLYDLQKADFRLPDPGAAGTVDLQGRNKTLCELVSAAAEARTLAIPTKLGQEVGFCLKTDGGDITLTVTSGMDQAGNTTIVFGDAGDSVRLYSINSGGNYRWRVSDFDGVTGPTLEMGALDVDTIAVDTNITLGTDADIIGGTNSEVIVQATGNIRYNAAVDAYGILLDDVGGNELLATKAVTSAVHYLGIESAATGNPCAITVQGGTNSGLDLQTKGTGQIRLLCGGDETLVINDAAATLVAATDTAGHACYIQTEDAGGTATEARVGGLLNIATGDGSAGAAAVIAGAGGASTIITGAGGAASGTAAGGASGSLTLQTGAAGAHTGGGATGAGGAGGTTTFTGGAGGATSNVGSDNGGAGGVFLFTCGVGGEATAGTGDGGLGGGCTINCGAGGASFGAAAGIGGATVMTSGTGGVNNTAAGVGGAGGGATVTTGAGGAGGAAGVGGAGGTMLLQTSAGAAPASGSANGGVGGPVQVTAAAGGAAGAGGGTGGDGGTITLTPGAAGGAGGGSAGVDGVVRNVGVLGRQQLAPGQAVTTATTLTVAGMLSGIITGTHTVGGTAALTLPTGTVLDAALPAAFAADDSFDFTIINASAAAADTYTLTDAASGTSIVGHPIVDGVHEDVFGSGSGTFRARKTAANTFIFYRIA